MQPTKIFNHWLGNVASRKTNHEGVSAMKSKYLITFRTPDKTRKTSIILAHGMHDACAVACKKIGVCWSFDSITCIGKDKDNVE
jgi:hypothetical protein